MGESWSTIVRFMLRSLYSHGKYARSPLDGRLVGSQSRSEHCAEEKIFLLQQIKMTFMKKVNRITFERIFSLLNLCTEILKLRSSVPYVLDELGRFSVRSGILFLRCYIQTASGIQPCYGSLQYYSIFPGGGMPSLPLTS
jgi:hypothetical protein